MLGRHALGCRLVHVLGARLRCTSFLVQFVSWLFAGLGGFEPGGHLVVAYGTGLFAQ